MHLPTIYRVVSSHLETWTIPGMHYSSKIHVGQCCYYNTNESR
jgi:hypothetical protein